MQDDPEKYPGRSSRSSHINRKISFLFNHFTVSKAIKPVIRKRLPRVKETEERGYSKIRQMQIKDSD